MRVNTLLSFLAKALLEVGTDNIGGVFVGFFGFFETIHIIVERIQKCFFFFLLLFELFLFELVGFEARHGDSSKLDSLLNTLHVPRL